MYINGTRHNSLYNELVGYEEEEMQWTWSRIQYTACICIFHRSCSAGNFFCVCVACLCVDAANFSTSNVLRQKTFVLQRQLQRL